MKTLYEKLLENSNNSNNNKQNNNLSSLGVGAIGGLGALGGLTTLTAHKVGNGNIGDGFKKIGKGVGGMFKKKLNPTQSQPEPRSVQLPIPDVFKRVVNASFFPNG